jgi:hypothetical protein
MPRGGARVGAGRKPSIVEPLLRTPQAQHGLLQIRDRIAKGELTDPLEVLLKFAANKKLHPQLRINAAGMATKFVHPLLAAVAVSHTSEIGVSDRQAQVHGLLDRLSRILPPEQKTIEQDAHNFISALGRLKLPYIARAIVTNGTTGPDSEP